MKPRQVLGCRAGAVSLAELVLVLCLLPLLLFGVTRFLMLNERLARELRDLRRGAEARRTAQVVLGGELRYLMPGEAVLEGDALYVRAFRGGGRVCRGAAETLELEYRGMRLPNPAKDSVVLLTEGSEVVRGVRSSARSEVCGPDGVRLTLDVPAPPAVWGMVFESGSYHAADGALRYRRGAEGRQPLTEAIFRDVQLRRGVDGGTVALDMVLPSRYLAGGQEPVPAEFALLNAARE
ncbi:MAG TPA: hypothetical protein VK966_12080 [Longimicrobiales bacterium]|nr:hypothetical protein [Longimicrobiales bacterium]